MTVTAVHVSFYSDQIEKVVDGDMLVRLFNRFGPVVKCVLKEVAINDRGQRGYCFVHFADTYEGIQQALHAIRVMDQHEDDGVYFKCNYSETLHRRLKDIEVQKQEQEKQRNLYNYSYHYYDPNYDPNYVLQHSPEHHQLHHQQHHLFSAGNQMNFPFSYETYMNHDTVSHDYGYSWPVAFHPNHPTVTETSFRPPEGDHLHSQRSNMYSHRRQSQSTGHVSLSNGRDLAYPVSDLNASTSVHSNSVNNLLPSNTND